MEKNKDVISSFRYGMDGGLELGSTLIQEEISKIDIAIADTVEPNEIGIHNAMQGILKGLLISFEHCKFGAEIEPNLLELLRKNFS